MAYMTIRQIKHQMCLNKLRDLGCKVISIQGVMFMVKYQIDDFKIAYMYHVNNDDTYYLERIKPYVVSAGDFKSEEEIVEAIKTDILQFKNAKKSRNFQSFIDLDVELFKTVSAFDDLFLYYNISKEDTQLVKDEINKIKELLNEVKSRSSRVFHDKDPKNI